MAKTRERSEVEYLRAENKRLKSENRHLKKKLGITNKKVQVYENAMDLSEPEMPLVAVEQEHKCSQCMDSLEIVDLGIRTLIMCHTCKTRKSVKK